MGRRTGRRGGADGGGGARPGGLRAAAPAPRVTAGRALLLVAMTCLVYLPAAQAGFIWDDDVYITATPLVEDLSGLRDIWLRPGASMQYYPLVFTTWWVEHHLWGASPAGYHLVNIALHAACALLLWALLRRLGVAGAYFAAAIFAVHPVFVESVAWCTELKNVQSAALYLLCLLAYFRASPADEGTAPPPGRRRGLYALALLLFAAGLLSKPAAVALPLVILLIIWWKRGRVGMDDALRVLPMLAMAVAMGLATIYAEDHFSAAGWDASLLERSLVAGRALVFYACKLVWPAALSSVYPRWEVGAVASWQVLFPLAVAATLAALWLMRARLGRGPLVAALTFVLLTGPALGFFDIAYYQYSFVADHLQYHAAPALIALFAAGVATLRERLRTGPLAGGVGVAQAALLLVLGALAWRHAGVFASEKTRCVDTIAKNPGAWAAMQSLGIELAREGDPRAAIRLYRQALSVKPDYADAHNNLGVALAETGDRQAAAREYREVLRIRPEHVEAHGNLANLLLAEGRLEEAAWHLFEAVRLRPNSVGDRISLADALLRLGRTGEAIAQLEQALEIAPGSPAARRALERARALQRPGGAPPGR